MALKLDKLKDLLAPRYDVFVTSLSYEDRCLSIINAIEGDIEIAHKLVSISSAHKQLMISNFEEFEKKKFRFLEINTSNQLETATNLLFPILDIIKANENATFLVDITTFTRQTLLILLRIFRNALKDSNQITFLYTPAKEYSIGLAFPEKWLTKGVVAVNSVFDFSGIIRPSRPYHLIILIGFEVERAAALIDSYEPSKITIGYAKKKDSISDENYELNRAKYEELICEYPSIEFFEFSCVDVHSCKKDILSQASKYADHNIIVSPMNNKISTLSCAMAAFENEEIQLAIAAPAIYNHENYSLPGECCHVIDVPEFLKNNILKY